VGLITLLISLGQAGGISFESAGARIGLGAGNTSVEFHQIEAFGNLNLGPAWELGHDWRLLPRLDGSTGWLGDPGHDSFTASAGPGFLFRKGRFPLNFEAGTSPTVITTTQFQTKDLGIPLQFTTHIGVNVDMGPALRLSYRFQHMSNAGFSHHNPGLNLHMLGVSYLF
jgi:lipid A 3-O-deacylase PagL